MKICSFLLVAAILVFTVATVAVVLKDPVCGLPHSQDGDGFTSCKAAFPLWTYRSDTNECIQFTYGGCDGNANRFASKYACETKCKE